MIANLQYGWTLFVDPIDAKDHWGRASIQVGAGIVADSDPKTEWLETCSKARGMILALRIASQESAQ